MAEKQKEAGLKELSHEEYLESHVKPTLEWLVASMLTERPANPVSFLVDKLTEEQSKLQKPEARRSTLSAAEVCALQVEVDQLRTKLNVAEKSVEQETTDDVTDDEMDDEDDIADLPDITQDRNAAGYNFSSRTSVSAEAYGAWNKHKKSELHIVMKTEEQKERIRSVLYQSFLFQNLDEQSITTLIDYMQEVVVEPGERIIHEGDDGDVLYVVEEGELHCLKKKAGETKQQPEEKRDTEEDENSPMKYDNEVVVKVCQKADAFGELALLYNCPRAASVLALKRSVLWEMDRSTFNQIVKQAASEKRQKYNKFLKEVPILQSMNDWEREKVADGLKQESYVKGNLIVKQGDMGNKFYIIEEGQATATKSFVEGQLPQEVMKYREGDYFGELSLLKNEPRAANVIATSENVTVISLDRASFIRLLGPLKTLLTRQAERYEQPVARRAREYI